MIIGILSDTHDRADMAAKAVKLLSSRGAEFFIHCGDVGSESVLDAFAGLRLAFVWGNNDFDRTTLGDYAQSLGLECYGDEGEFEQGGRRFAVTHGDDPRIMRRVLDAQQCDYLCVGHTHLAHVSRVGRTVVVNPGALYRASRKTVALLDTNSDQLESLEVR